MNLVKKTLYVFLIFNLYLLCVIEPGNSESKKSKGSNKLSIKLKARAIVLGPNITLGDVSHISTRNSTIREKLLTIKIGLAPPPGESSEIKLSYIKRCLTVAGFDKYTDAIKGPRTVRIITAQVEIDKAILKEEFAKFIKDTAPLATFEV